MFDRVIMGVDPGTAATGVAVVGDERGKGVRIVSAQTVRTPSNSPEADRLRSLYAAVRGVLQKERPAAVAVERLMWGRNVGSGMSVARATGVVLLAAAEMSIPVHEYAPLEVKMALTGNGAARKEDVHRMLDRFLTAGGVPGDGDAADAVAVAVCHLHRARLDLAEAQR
jgi:crossover junction endodeoxyribonuclease RuvC